MYDSPPHDQPIKVEPFHSCHHSPVIELGYVQDQCLDPALNFRRQVSDAFFASFLIDAQKWRYLNWLAEVYQRAAAINLFCRKRQAYGHDFQTEFSVVSMLQFQSH